jgi:succinyl-CoA synthetase beta subunit
VSAALELVLSNARVRVLLVNVLGGITRCDEIAKGILEVRRRGLITKPMVVRLVGTNEGEGRRLLREAGVSSLGSMEEAVREAVRLASR